MKNDDTRTAYEVMLDGAGDLGLTVHEDHAFESQVEGLIVGEDIYLSDALERDSERRQVLDEEMVHYRRDRGDITDMDDRECRKRELRTRREVIKHLVPIKDLLKAVVTLKEGASPYALAKLLDVEEPLVRSALKYYSKVYPTSIYGGYLVKFVPLSVVPLTKDALFGR